VGSGLAGGSKPAKGAARVSGVMPDLDAALHELPGHSSFRRAQEEAVAVAMAGRDVLMAMARFDSLLSRRRSRVRVPSLPFAEGLQIRLFSFACHGCLWVRGRVILLV
jgi:hypothetical protein